MANPEDDLTICPKPVCSPRRHLHPPGHMHVSTHMWNIARGGNSLDVSKGSHHHVEQHGKQQRCPTRTLVRTRLCVFEEQEKMDHGPGEGKRFTYCSP